MRKPSELVAIRGEDSRELRDLRVLRTRRTKGWVNPRHWGIIEAIGSYEIELCIARMVTPNNWRERLALELQRARLPVKQLYLYGTVFRFDEIFIGGRHV